MSDPTVQLSTQLRGEPQVVVRVSSPSDIDDADMLLDQALGLTEKMKKLKENLSENPTPDAVSLIQNQLGGTVIAEYAPSNAAPPAPSGNCSQGSKGAHPMLCKQGHPVGPRKAMGSFFGHECLTNPKSDNNPNGCKPAWCN